jgi:hypothetical protein
LTINTYHGLEILFLGRLIGHVLLGAECPENPPTALKLAEQIFRGILDWVYRKVRDRTLFV